MQLTYKMPAPELLGEDRASNITFFLLENCFNPPPRRNPKEAKP